MRVMLSLRALDGPWRSCVSGDALPVRPERVSGLFPLRPRRPGLLPGLPESRLPSRKIPLTFSEGNPALGQNNQDRGFFPVRISEEHRAPGVCQGFCSVDRDCDWHPGQTHTCRPTALVSGGGRETLAPPCLTDTPGSPSPSRAVAGEPARSFFLLRETPSASLRKATLPPTPMGFGCREGPHGLQGWVGEGAIAKRRSLGARPRGGTCVPLTREVLVLVPGSGSPWGAVPGVRQGPACPFQAGEAPRPRKPLVNGAAGGRWSPLPTGPARVTSQAAVRRPPGGISQQPCPPPGRRVRIRHSQGSSALALRPGTWLETRGDIGSYTPSQWPRPRPRPRPARPGCSAPPRAPSCGRPCGSLCCRVRGS